MVLILNKSKIHKIISSVKIFQHKLSVCGFLRTVYALKYRKRCREKNTFSLAYYFYDI